jgi:hypothetical protein
VDPRYGGQQWGPSPPQFTQISQQAQDPQSPAHPQNKHVSFFSDISSLEAQTKISKHAEWAKGMASKFGSAMLFGAGATFGGDMINDALSHV